MLIAADVDILTIYRRLGVSKHNVTLDTHGRLIEGADAAAEVIALLPQAGCSFRFVARGRQTN